MPQFVLISKWKTVLSSSPGWLNIDHVNILAENSGVLRSLVPGAVGTDDEVAAIFQNLVMNHYASSASLTQEGKMAGYKRSEKLPELVMSMMMFEDEADFIAYSSAPNGTWTNYCNARDEALSALGVVLCMKKFSIENGNPMSWDRLMELNTDGLEKFYDSLDVPEEIRPAKAD